MLTVGVVGTKGGHVTTFAWKSRTASLNRIPLRYSEHLTPNTNLPFVLATPVMEPEVGEMVTVGDGALKGELAEYDPTQPTSVKLTALFGNVGAISVYGVYIEYARLSPSKSVAEEFMVNEFTPHR